MGVSITLFKKEFLELSLEVDRHVALEMSTGFGVSERVTVSVAIPTTVEDLEKIIAELQRSVEQLKASWKCADCGLINNQDNKECDVCDRPRTQNL